MKSQTEKTLAPKNITKVLFEFYSFFAEKTDYDKLAAIAD